MGALSISRKLRHRSEQLFDRRGKTRTDSYAYNTRSELTEASLGANPYAYDYDNIGNRKTAQEIAQESTYAANTLNQYTAITRNQAPFTPTFDADGNQALVQTSTGIWKVTYNADSRPVRFTQQGGTTTIECGYDYMGRRYEKKITVDGTITLHQHYLYRGYLQIAALDKKRTHLPALWYTHWDPTEPTSTRPLSIRKNGTWYTYGCDLTKNVQELFTATGAIATTYDYTPFGAVTRQGAFDQPFQWSSEVNDVELALTYYNYRHYNPMDGRWINRDPIAEQGGYNLYAFVGNEVMRRWDELGNIPSKTRKCPKSKLKNHPTRNPVLRMYRTREQNTSIKIEANGCGSEGGLKFQNDFSYNGGKISFSFREACDNHDRCYATCGSVKEDCDTTFYNDMNKVCETSANNPYYIHTYRECRDRKNKYYSAVNWAGKIPFESSQDKHCIWEECCVDLEPID